MVDIYLTHCSKEKDLNLKGTNREVTPNILYTETGIQRFMKRCIEKKVRWAILSDNYGIFFSYEKHGWYAKPPDTVSPEEEQKILRDFDEKLGSFDTIYFFIRPDSYHPFYDHILKTSSLYSKIKLIYDLCRIAG